VGECKVTIKATDAAGNSSSTNLVFLGVDGPVITMEEIDPKKLWDAHVDVKGKVVPANNSVWVNGVQATVSPDGSWFAAKVPIGWPCIFEMTALPVGETKSEGQKSKDMVAAQATLGTNSMVLNATSPACGLFQLYLNNPVGKGFILFASTNMVQWTPILTNASPEAGFDYSEDSAHHACRFFKVVPLP
jgi:hypothetical protein